MSEQAGLRDQIAARLDGIPEPCSIAMNDPMSMVEMGLIDDIAICDDGAVTVTLCLTDPGCVHYMRMAEYIADALMPLDGVSSVKVRQTLDKLWSDDRVRRRA